jgi:ankyrin repeat protein
MTMTGADRLKLAAAIALLLVTASAGLYLFIDWSAAPPQETATTQASLEPPTTAPTNAGPSGTDIRRFAKLVQADDIKQATAMLAKDPALASVKNAMFRASPLHLVSSVAMAKLLIDNGADVNALDAQYSATPLRWAVSNCWNHSQEQKDLQNFLASKSPPETDIYYACALGDMAQVQKLLADNPKLVNKRSDNNDALFGGGTPIQVAAYANQVEVIKYLLDHGANVRDRSEWHNTEAIEKAAWCGSTEAVQLLVDRGATVNGTTNDFKDCPLYASATAGHADIVKILLAHGAATSPFLIHAVQTAMAKAHPGDANTGTPQEFQEIIAMLKALPPAPPPR